MPKTSSKGSGKPHSKIELDLELSAGKGKELLETLQARFEKNMQRHKGLAWPKIQAKLEAHPDKLSSLHAMESSDRSLAMTPGKGPYERIFANL